MRIFEPHAHMFSRVTDDYEAMALAGVVAILEPAFWLGQPRTHVQTFIDYFDTLLGWEAFRASQYGIRHFCTMGLNPKEANDPRVNEAVLEILPGYLEKDGVLGVGEIGFDDQTPAEERFFIKQLELAIEHELPVLIHTPHRDKVRGTQRTLDVVRDVGMAPEMVLVDHNTEETVGMVQDSGCYMGFSIYPNTKMDEERMCRILKSHGLERKLINSACDWGRSDPLKVPKTAHHMRKRGFSEAEVQTIVWDNPVTFFAQSDRLDREAFEKSIETQRSDLFEGNSIHRGQDW